MTDNDYNDGILRILAHKVNEKTHKRIYENRCEFSRIYANLFEFMRIYENLCEFIRIYGNL